MKTITRRSNGNKVQGKSFKSILQEMMKLTDGGNLRVANNHWDIFHKPVNNTTYTNYNTGA